MPSKSICRAGRFALAAFAIMAVGGGCAKPSLSNKEWKTLVLDANVPVLVDFSREECPGCKIIGPKLEKLVSEFEGKTALYKIDTDVSADLVKKNHISRLPAVLLFVNGVEVKRWEGVLDIKPYRQALKTVVDGKTLEQPAAPTIRN